MKRVTIAEIAERAGVSIGAVSYALNGRPGVSEETRKRIMDIADEIGWRPSLAAKSLSGSRSHSVGLIIARPADTLGVEPFFMRFISGLERELSGHRIALLLQVVEDHRAAIEAMRLCWAERRIDGIVVTDLYAEDTRIPVIEELRIPAVLAGRPRTDARLGAVWTDDTAAVDASVDYLVALGHRRIARVAGLPALDHTQVRIAAFREAMARHGLSEPQVVETDYTAEEGAQATRALLSRRDRPTAILFDNDVMALAAINVAQEMGIAVPGELSIVAGDDSQLCVLVRPALTALSWDIQAYGLHTAQVLLDMIDGRPPRTHQENTARLVIRGSTAAPPPA
ncbi:DNA-binding LacI/PurR family transcriptional regulator [Kitasatospora gansuensis]|uniref:DNA-binding LacI/PurR family transcriptional regulator n=1 Tax=Kitasatospora gansuensis TaxID=258050 RepID=A0A7W7WKV1_9ACTN|nr:LacI family DNA-binding transcriptional regulator [Kitasatospora gansuensis]MBB4951207.1 DNA-binding LacI/PurR family transcriptional regulator [Kitasatospora gansuensis]